VIGRQGGYTFEQYFNDPDIMVDVQMQFIEYRDTRLFYDHIMGLRNIDLALYPDFQNVFEPNWLGCPVYYPGRTDPGAIPILTDENKYDYIKHPIDPFAGLMGKAAEYYRYFKELQKKGYTYKGKPLTYIWNYGNGTDGPLTNACSVRGATEMCLDLYCDTEYAIELLDFITENTITRIKAARKEYGVPEKTPSFSFADDSIAMLSPEDYKRFILPFHKKLVSALSTGEKPNGFHLCGDATRHFKTIRDDLNVRSFDTGFPVRHGALIKELGSEVQISGGVHVDILKSGGPEAVEKETKRILDEVKPLSRSFIIKEANNVSPRTPPENLLAMYNTVKKYGFFEDQI
jgi:uroporphyrinogen-III decarboxylase